MLDVQLLNDAIQIGEHFTLTFQRTLRIPDDGNTYPLPPGLERFPIRRVVDYVDRVPPAWREHGGVFIPMYQREAMWLNFNGNYQQPCVAKVTVGKVNALTGRRLHRGLNRTRRHQNYVVVPDQPWLDGINAGRGFIRQFVAMPLGAGYTVEEQVTGEDIYGGIQLVVYAPKPGKFEPLEEMHMLMALSPAAEMGLGAGGRMKQKIYPDKYGQPTWDQDNFGRVFIHIANSLMYKEITGEDPPPTIVSAQTYTMHGLPWFDLYDEDMGDVDPSKTLATVKSVDELAKEKGNLDVTGDASVEVPDEQIVTLVGKKTVHDGKW